MPLHVKRDRHLLYIIHVKKQKILRYNLKLKCMEKRDKDGYWDETSRQYDFFQGYGIHSLKGEYKFMRLIELTKTYNNHCTSLATFFDRLGECMIYENFLDEGVAFRPHRSYWGRKPVKHLKHPLRDYDKNTIKLLKETQKEVNIDFERHYFENKDFFSRCTNQILLMDVDTEKKHDLFKAVISQRDHFEALIDQYRYDIKALFNFVVEYLQPFENLNYTESAQLLDDYYRMANAIGRKVKKYPKYLKSMHDIIMANHESYQKDYPEEIFLNVQKPELEFKGKMFCVVTPKCSKDVVCEGTSLNHCVSSYVDKILSGKTLIIFMRYSATPEDSLITLEFKDNKIVQARGSYNRNLTDEEKEFLTKYCEKKKIELTI